MKFNHIYFILILIGTAFSMQCQKQPNNDTVPLDQSIRYGKLPNGFTYYIKPTSSPSDKINMSLILKGGSSIQDMDQIDIAHFMEHMAFKSSENFPLGIKAPNQLDSLEMEFRDITAFTSKYYTQYVFEISEKNLYALKKGILWFKDIVGGGLKLTTKEIDAERGVLIQERIGKNSNGADLREISRIELQSKIDPGARNWQNDLNYHLEYYRTFEPDILRRYYNDWYRPDLGALMIVGNIKDVDGLEAMVKKRFSKIPTPRNPRRWKNTDSIYFNQEPQFAKVACTPENQDNIDKQQVILHLGYRDPYTKAKLHTEVGLKRELLWNILSEALLIRTRLEEEQYNMDFSTFNKYLTYNKAFGIFQARNMFTIFIDNKNNSAKKGTENATRLLRQLYQYGLLEEEWKMLKKEELQQMDNGKSKSGSSWIKEMSSHFIYGEALPEDKSTYLKDWFQGLSLAQVNEEIKALIPAMPDDIGIAAYEGNSVLSLNENDIRSWIKNAWNAPVQAYRPPEIPENIMQENKVLSLTKRNFTDKGINQDTGAHELVLDNGIKVVLLPLNEDSRKVKIHGFNPHGAQCFEGRDYFSAIHAADIVLNAGISDKNKFEINRYLSSIKNKVKVRPYIDVAETGINGEAMAENMEAMFQLIYLYIREPRKDPDAFSDWKKSSIENYVKWHMPRNDMANAMKSLTGDYNINYNNTTAMVDGLPEVTIDKSYEHYKDLFGRTRDFTFTITGDYDKDVVINMVQQYLGNLPDRASKKESKSDYQKRIKLDNGPILYRIPVPDYAEGNEGMVYAEKYIVTANFGWKERIKVDALITMIRNRLLTVLRNHDLSVYTPAASGGYNFECARYEISLRIDFNAMGTEKEKDKKFRLLQETIHQLLEEIKNGTINKNEVERVFKEIDGKYSTGFFNNSRIDERLYEYYKYDATWLDKTEVENYLRSLDIEDVMETAKKYLNKNHRYEFIMGK
ncbi:M16 family metallopeptidase [Sinomicrobium weinanense]|uniref:Insulinase family protein n=1 Tax=Sinomicrobium weinanense TaxID=2842200 RepID=A0A926Q106_9FLAO|nr:insulinase family protein [Sinomicrobium weinanense]MBC9795382.1 insulinase family protein [Sinomicrobium weinanense]MBU3122903.1 insulinase family protein [Sinomicrobium weinanense]